MIKLWFAGLLFALAAPLFAETLTNDTIIALSASGLGDEAIVAKIHNSDSNFELSSPSLITLKNRGVSSSVIAAMISSSSAKDQVAQSLDSPDPMVNHPAGLYLLDETASATRMVKVDASVQSQMKMGNTLGYAFSYGLSPITMKISIQGESAHVRSAAKQPTFYLFLAAEAANRATVNPYSLIANGAILMASSPNEFSLIRLTPKSGHRESKVGNFSITGTQMGVMDKDRITFDYKQIREGVYKVTVNAPMASGEYAFLKSGALVGNLFDFSILP